SAVAEQIRGNVQRDTVPLLLALADGRVEARRLPDVTADGRAMPALEVALPGAKPLTLLFDPATSLVARARYRFASAPGDEVGVEEVYSDYRDVRGLKVAFKIQLRRDGAPSIERAVRAFDFNVPLDAALFTKPS
ncbi:MAG: hypothetical protein ABI818_16685, partial [Acidobacteriota bacterium]